MRFAARLTGLAGALGLSLAAGPAAAVDPLDADPPSATQLLSWVRTNIGVTGWAFAGGNIDQKRAMFVYLGLFDDAGYPDLIRVWVRGERYAPRWDSNSYMVRTEINCRTPQSRQLQGIYYKDNNLGGEVVYRLDQMPEYQWSEPMPMSSGEAIIGTACAVAAARRGAPLMLPIQQP